MRKTSVLVALLSLNAAIMATATELTDVLSLQGVGYSVAEDGAGLEELGAGVVDVTVDIGGPVVTAYLYWAGRELPCTEVGGACETIEPFGDQVMSFDGNIVDGTIIGTEENFGLTPGRKLSIGYRADVTDIVSAAGTGLQTFTIADGDLSNNLDRLNGAGLLVVYVDPANPTNYLILAKDGMDFAYVNATPGPEAKTTVPVTFAFDAVGGARDAEVVVFSGDNEERPDRIAISDNADVNDQLNGADGVAWDTLVLDVVVPAGSSGVTVELISPLEFADVPSDSLLWTVGALRIPLFGCATDDDCNDNTVCTADVCDLTTGVCINRTIDGCCAVDADCDDDTICTTDVCDPDTGICTNTRVPDCCEIDDDCDDDNLCTADTCDPDTGTCTYTTIDGCCLTDADCNDSVVCTADVCDVATGDCIHTVIPDCCQLNEDCDDNDACTSDVCETATGTCESTPIPGCGGEGCTPGYWKQCHHSCEWIVYLSTDLFDNVFGVSSSHGLTLKGALEQGGGGEAALGRHAVAALLNAASGNVNYLFSEADVIGIVQAAYADCAIGQNGCFNGYKAQLEAQNGDNTVCPLGNCPGIGPHDCDCEAECGAEVLDCPERQGYTYGHGWKPECVIGDHLKIKSSSATLIVTAGDDTCETDLCDLVKGRSAHTYGWGGGWNSGGHHDSKRGKYVELHFGATGDCDVTAVIDYGCGEEVVEDGQIIELDCDASEKKSGGHHWKGRNGGKKGKKSNGQRWHNKRCYGYQPPKNVCEAEWVD